MLSIDGRFLDCNAEFERLVGYRREELLPRENLSLIVDEALSSAESAGEAAQGAAEKEASASNTRNLSLFNLLSREHMEGVFLAMSEMLKHPPEKGAHSGVVHNDFWTGHIFLSRNMHVKVRELIQTSKLLLHTD